MSFEFTALMKSLEIHLATIILTHATTLTQHAVGTRLFGNTFPKNGSRITSAITGGTFSISVWSSEK